MVFTMSSSHSSKFFLLSARGNRSVALSDYTSKAKPFPSLLDIHSSCF